MAEHKARIGVIGTGFAGVVTAVRLLENADSPIEVILVEREIGKRYGGLAYGKGTAGWEHLLNLQAGRVSIFREHRFDFLQWVNEEADREEWPLEWKNLSYQISSPVARRIYQQYLECRLMQAERKSPSHSTLVQVSGEVTNLRETVDQVALSFAEEVRFEDAITSEISVDYVILATGHLENILPTFASKVQDHPFFIRDQYSHKGRNLLRRLEKEDAVMIVGSSLRAFDVVLSLHAVGHEGPIYLVSRNGLVHPTYPPDHEHEIIEVERPAFLDADIMSENELVAHSLGWFQQELEYQVNRLNEKRSVLIERILKASEPFISELVHKLPASTVEKLYSLFKTHLTTNRVGVIPEIGDIITNKMKKYDNGNAQLILLKGHISDINWDEAEGMMRTQIQSLNPGSDEKTVIESKVVFSSVGRETDYKKVSSTLWRNLIDSGLAISHKQTNRGIEVTKFGEVIDHLGTPSNRVHAVGIMREGDETQRNGRVGSFVFSIGPIRNQAFYTAVSVLEKIYQSDVDYTPIESFDLEVTSIQPGQILNYLPISTRGLSDLEQQKVNEMIAELIANYINKYAARSTDIRQHFVAKITEDLDAMLLFLRQRISAQYQPHKMLRMIDVYAREKALEGLIDIKKVTYDQSLSFLK